MTDCNVPPSSTSCRDAGPQDDDGLSRLPSLREETTQTPTPLFALDYVEYSPADQM